MSMVAKILVFVNLVLAVMVMAAAGAYLKSAEDWKGRNATLQLRYDNDIKEKSDSLKQAIAGQDEALKAKAAAETAKSAAEATAKTLSENLNIQQKSGAAMLGSLNKVEATMGDFEKNLASARAENAALQNEKAAADAEKRAALEAKSAAETEQKRLTNELENATASLDAAQKAKVALAEQLEATTTTLQIYKDKYPSPTGTGSPVKGMVLAADSKGGVYLISVGKADVKQGDELTVSRGEKFVAQVVVDRVLGDDKASVVVKTIEGRKQQQMDIMQGDRVATVN